MGGINVGCSSPGMKLLRVLAVAGVLLPLSPAMAQESGETRIRVGLGAQFRPEYIGADKREPAPLIDISVARGGKQFDFEAPDDNFDLRIINKNGFSLGPVANLQSGRKNSDVGAAVGKVKTTIEAGVFVQYEIGESVRLRSEVRKGIGGHKGGVASVGGDYIWRDGDRYVLSVGPRVLLSDARYQRAWFGVSPEASLATGLSQYRPGSGVHALAMTSGASYQFNRDWGLFGYARYERLVGDAAKSPLVRSLGSKNQSAAGLGVTYAFSIKR